MHIFHHIHHHNHHFHNYHHNNYYNNFYTAMTLTLPATPEEQIKRPLTLMQVQRYQHPRGDIAGASPPNNGRRFQRSEAEHRATEQETGWTPRDRTLIIRNGDRPILKSVYGAPSQREVREWVRFSAYRPQVLHHTMLPSTASL